MDNSVIQDITRILTEFAATKFSAQVLEVKGPIQEGAIYRWRMVSNRFKEVTVVAKTKKSFLGKPSLAGIEVYGLGQTTMLKPDLQDLQDFLAKADMTAAL